MTDPRDLIQRLATVVSVLAEEYSGYSELAQEARTYLAQPKPEPTFTPEEVEMIAAPWSLLSPEPAAEPTLDDILDLCAEHEFMLGVDGANEEESANGLLVIARAVLARWGGR